MTTSIFAETISKAISEYRQMLRRYLTQVERVNKLSQLGLKDPTIYDSDVRLFEMADAIVKDIDINMDIPEQGYYSYSGLKMFRDYLKDYLKHYQIEDGHVVHSAQKASRAMITAIQLAALPSEKLTDDIKSQIRSCNEIIATYGSDEQRELYRTNLKERQAVNEEFFGSMLNNFMQYLMPETQTA